jgi:photosystem II stability/assembly factor-like uncharacterized protein
MRHCLLVVAFVAASFTAAHSQLIQWQELTQVHGGVSVGEDGNLYVNENRLFCSTDHGATWDSIPRPSGYWSYALYVTATGVIYVGVDAALYVSTNRGAEWKSIPLLPDVDYVSALSIDANSLLYAGLRMRSGGNGALFVTPDGGGTWLPVKMTNYWLKHYRPVGRFIHQMKKNASGRIMMATHYGGAVGSYDRSPWARFLTLPRSQSIKFGPSDDAEEIAVALSPANASRGTFYRSRDGGFRWNKVARPPIDAPLTVPVRMNGRYYMGTVYGVFASSNDGTTWSKENTGFPHSDVMMIDDMVSSGGYLIAQSAGFIYRGTIAPGAGAVAGSRVAAAESAPLAYSLGQNFPNPFNPSTTIPFQLKEEALVTVRVYDVLGRLVATPADGELFGEGDGEATFDGAQVSSGLYYYTIAARRPGDAQVVFTASRRMLLLR